MEIALMCDMHLPANNTTAQYAYFKQAMEDIKHSNAEILIVNGDISASGEQIALDEFLNETKGVNKIVVLGNSDVRHKNQSFFEVAKGGEFDIGRKIICINTPYSKIEDKDREKINTMSDDDILIMHYSIAALEEESQNYITNILSEKKIIIIHAHAHNSQDYILGKGRVICLRALDPDKVTGAPPTITYLNVDKNNFVLKEKHFSTSKEKIKDIRDYLGISCFDVISTIEYAISNDIKNLELRKYSENDGLFNKTVEGIKQWRKSCGQVLSIHMPNIFYKDNKICDEGWNYAKKLLNKTEVDSVTIHPPRVSVDVMSKDKNIFVDYYARFIEQLPETTKVGIENLHMSPGAEIDNSRQFGCTPIEQYEFIDSINKHFGYERVGGILDVGHAYNNRPFSEIYTNGMWYALVGNKTVAYHIHQVKRSEGKLSNHRELDNWFGGMISYSSFFWAWLNNQIAKRPMFLEMRELNQAKVSIEAFNNINEF